MILCLCISVGLAFVLMLDNLLSLVKGFFFFFFFFLKFLRKKLTYFY